MKKDDFRLFFKKRIALLNWIFILILTLTSNYFFLGCSGPLKAKNTKTTAAFFKEDDDDDDDDDDSDDDDDDDDDDGDDDDDDTVKSPEIKSLSETQGPIKGGTNLWIYGKNFGSDKNSVQVFFGENEATILNLSDEDDDGELDLEVTTPSHEKGAVDVIVQLSAEIKDTKKGGFEYKGDDEECPDEDDCGAGSEPQILSLSVSEGSEGGNTKLWIYGRNFNKKNEDMDVFFGEVKAQIKKVEDNNSDGESDIQVETPAHEVGMVDVEVQVDKKGVAILEDGFEYTEDSSLKNPRILSISPDKGSEGGGTIVWIMGENFTSKDNMSVKFGDFWAEIVSVEDHDNDNKKDIKVKTPAHELGVVNVMVTVDGRGADTLQNGYTYEENTSLKNPTIKSLTVTEGPTAGGTKLWILGENFKSDKNEMKVFFDNSKAKILLVEDYDKDGKNDIKVRTPEHLKGKVDVRVRVNKRGVALSEGAFEYKEDDVGDCDGEESCKQPTILSLSVDHGSTAGGTRLWIYGKNFKKDESKMKVFFGDVKAKILNVKDKNKDKEVDIEVKTPSHIAGTVNVNVFVKGLGNAQKENGFTYEQEEDLKTPSIKGLSKTEGPDSGGEKIWIYGKNFKNKDDMKVFFGDSKAKILDVSDKDKDGEKDIKVETPEHAEGLADVQVHVKDRGVAESKDAYNYVLDDSKEKPVILNISPAEGSTNGGDKIWIYGKNFRDKKHMVVKFGGIKAEILDVAHKDKDKEKDIKVKIPPHVVGSVDVEVHVDKRGVAVSTQGFTYKEDANNSKKPEILSLSVRSGKKGDKIWIYGKNFRGIDHMKVYFGTVKAKKLSVEDKDKNGEKDIKVEVPKQNSNNGTFEIKVHVDERGDAIDKEGFTYQ